MKKVQNPFSVRDDIQEEIEAAEILRNRRAPVEEDAQEWQRFARLQRTIVLFENGGYEEIARSLCKLVSALVDAEHVNVIEALHAESPLLPQTRRALRLCQERSSAEVATYLQSIRPEVWPSVWEEVCFSLGEKLLPEVERRIERAASRFIRWDPATGRMGEAVDARALDPGRATVRIANELAASQIAERSPLSIDAKSGPQVTYWTDKDARKPTLVVCLNVGPGAKPIEARIVGQTACRLASMVLSQPGQTHTWAALLRDGIQGGYWIITSPENLARRGRSVRKALGPGLRGYWEQTGKSVEWVCDTPPKEVPPRSDKDVSGTDTSAP